MAIDSKTAYVTGGASGLGKATATMLVKKGIKVFIADRDTSTAESVVSELNDQAGSKVAFSGLVDTTDWNSQTKAFTQAISALDGRIDYVYPIAGIGERRWLPKLDETVSAFEAPDLTVLDVDLKGVMYTVSLAVQQFRRQDVQDDTRGQIGCVASVCGLYCVPSLPIYTAAKFGLTGFVRSYGKYLPNEQITLNAVNPNVIRTNISTSEFYDHLESKGLLAPIEGVVETFEALIDGELVGKSGETFEIGPNYGKKGEKWVAREPTKPLDEDTQDLLDLLDKRARPLQEPV